MFAESNHRAPVREHSVNSTPYAESSTVTSQELSSEQSEAARTRSLRPFKQKEVFQALQMTTKMKGLLKGLRYISQIFDNNGKEQEMQIGYPTDVKHVAHIGWDGPSTNDTPSWMDGYRPTSESLSAPLSTNRDANGSKNGKDASLEDLHRTGAGIDGSLHRDMPELPKPSRRQPSAGTTNTSSFGSPRRDKPKQRRHQSATGGISISSPSRVAAEGSSRRSQSTGLSMDSPLQDQPPADPKKSSRRKKSNKGISSGEGGSTRPSRSKAQSNITYTSPFSDPGSGRVSELNNELGPISPLKSRGDGKGDQGNHGIS